MTGCHAIVAIAFAVVSAMSFAQEGGPKPDSNISCVDRIKLPTYPLLAQQARVSGTVNANVVLSSTALPQRVETNAATNAPHAKGVLAVPVERAIREAIFNSTCGGKTVELVFIFEIGGVTNGRPKQTISYGFPNRFWIGSEAPHFQPQSTNSEAGSQP